VALEIDQIRLPLLVTTVEKVIEANVIEGGGRGGKGGNVATQVAGLHVRTQYHDQRIPTHQRTYAAFHEHIAGHSGFIGMMMVLRKGVVMA